jgi:tetraacyldisaccharide 4'-kinase
MLGEPVAIGRPNELLRQPGQGTVFAVAGIANPERFVTALEDAGWNVLDALTFPDHHRYTPADVTHIAGRVAASRADAVFTTDKDAVRFEGLGPGLPFPICRVPLTVRFEPEDALFGAVRAVLR